jgi:nitrous oxidase accessory protein NosD
VSAATSGGTVVVCGGTYDEDVTVSKALSLSGEGRPVIDATGQINGFLVKAAHVRITGFTVTGAIGEGILVDSVNDATIEHNPDAAPDGVPAPKTAGVYDNLISGNTIAGNGTEGQGAGVVLATGLPGGAVYDNIVEHNTISGNGISGVTVHSHVPGQFLNGNVVTGNLITVNNLDGDNDFAPHVDDQTTGVLVATVDPLTIEVTGNEIAGDHFGIWTTGPVTVGHANDDFFAGDAVPVAQG